MTQDTTPPSDDDRFRAALVVLQEAPRLLAERDCLRRVVAAARIERRNTHHDLCVCQMCFELAALDKMSAPCQDLSPDDLPSKF